MKRKSGKSEKDNSFHGIFYGSISKSTFKKFKRNGNCHRCGIYRQFARECIAPHLIQESNVVQQANLVQNEMFQLF